MRRLLLAALLCIFMFNLTSAQVFNTASTLKKGQWALGFEPAILAGDNIEDLYIFGYGGVGITSGVDLGLRVGLGEETYFGGDVEFMLGKNFSISAGAHSWYNFGLDGTALLSFPIGKNGVFFTGFDMDIDFAENETYTPAWIPVGVEIKIKKSMAFMFEANINVIEDYYHFIGGGLMLYF